MIEKLVNEYGIKKNELDVLKKDTDALNTQIKEWMIKEGKDSYKTDKYVVTFVVQHRESMNELKLLDIAKKNNLHNIIKTIEVVDMDELENALYNGEIAQDIIKQISTCKEVKDVNTIKIKEIK